MLYVTPEVNGDGTVTVDVLPAISQLIGIDTSPDGQQTAPRMDIKSLSTIARLRPDESVMIGGLIYDSTATQSRSVPGLARHSAPRQSLRHERAPAHPLGALSSSSQPNRSTEDAMAAAPSPSERQPRPCLREAVADGASDLHLEPREKALDVRHRIDGRLIHRRFLEDALREPVIQAAKIAGHMDIAERRLPQDGQGLLLVGLRRYHLQLLLPPGDQRRIDGRAPDRRRMPACAPSQKWDSFPPRWAGSSSS